MTLVIDHTSTMSAASALQRRPAALPTKDALQRCNTSAATTTTFIVTLHNSGSAMHVSYCINAFALVPAFERFLASVLVGGANA